MEVLDDSPCNGVCRMKDNHCISCGRDYEDLAQWLYMSRESRLERMKQLKQQVMTHNGVTNGKKRSTKETT